MENDGSTMFTVEPYDYANLKVGDEVIRWLAGTVEMKLRVTALTDDIVTCGWWTFDRKTGVEIDDDIPGVVSFLGKSVQREK